jgi:hypothetical protein
LGDENPNCDSDIWKGNTFGTRCKHAGENLAEVLKQRSPDLPPAIQMCDALSRNVPKLGETLVANCNAHNRRNFVKVTVSFPQQCRFVLETLGEVYGYDEQARAQGMSAEQRLHFHQEHSGPVMERLHLWCRVQFEERKVEPNSGLGSGRWRPCLRRASVLQFQCPHQDAAHLLVWHGSVLVAASATGFVVGRAAEHFRRDA